MTVSAEWSTLILVVTCKSSTTAQETIILLLELPSKRFRLPSEKLALTFSERLLSEIKKLGKVQKVIGSIKKSQCNA